MKKRKIFYAFIILVLLLAVGLKALAWRGEKAFKTITEKTLSVFHEKISDANRTAYEAKDFSSLPEAVQKYLQKAMPPQGMRIKNVRIKQKGEIRVHDEASWKPFTAVQFVSQLPPQLIWAGNAEHWPMVNLEILTSYIDGRGETSVYLWGLFSAFQNRGSEMKAYLMVRWLGEAVWYPTALLPGKDISWETVESSQQEVNQARVRFTHGDMTVSGVFTFMKSTGAPLMFMVEDGAMPALSIYRWYCNYSDWTRFQDYQIPRKVTEGLIYGSLREDRLKINVSAMDFELQGLGKK